MKRFIFLLLASVTLLTSFTMPPVIQEDPKDNWVYNLKEKIQPLFSAPFIKPTNTVFPTVLSDSEPVNNFFLTLINYGSSNDVDLNVGYDAQPYQRRLHLKIKLNTFGTYVGSVVTIPPNTYGMSRALFSCSCTEIEWATGTLKPWSD